MKKYTLFICALFFLLSAVAQNRAYIPFPTKNAIWVNRTGWRDGSNALIWNDPIFYCTGTRDTVIGSRSYARINYCGKAYHGALRDDNGKVYYIPADSVRELLIYDFTVKAGDTVSVYFMSAGTFPFMEYSNKVYKVDSILINGSYRKRIHFANQFKWIEGIGNSKGLFVEFFVNVSGWDTEILCMSVDDIKLFPSFSLGKCSTVTQIPSADDEHVVRLFPNPTMGKITLEQENRSIIIAEILDIYGRTALTVAVKDNSADMDLSSLPSGIYMMRLTDAEKRMMIKKIIKE